MAKIRYAKRYLTNLYDVTDLKTKKVELLWGDWLRIGDDINDKWSKIQWGRDTFAIKKEDYQEERLLEMIFLDVGQGDSCILTTPLMGASEKILILDAGKGDNLFRYLNYRFKDFKKKFRFHAAIITHSDEDHYGGFQKVFENEQISFDNVYHNGLMEQTGDDLFGPMTDGLLPFYASKTAVSNLYSDEGVRGNKRYPKLIWTALKNGRVGDVSMLSTRFEKRNEHAWMPGFSPSDQPEFTIEVLGPVVEKGPNGKKGLRPFPKSLTDKAMDNGKTKNGHSVILKLKYRDFSILLGGDLNLPAEHFLLRTYGYDGETPTTLDDTYRMIEKAKGRFGVDLLKSCHHGSADVSDEFLETTQPVGFIISSGDEESYVHPRPELLGLLGKKGRGPRPLVLCTEILRSTKEKDDRVEWDEVVELATQMALEQDAEKKAKLKKELETKENRYRRNVGVYGAINLRTDGRTALIGFRNEKPKGIKRWITYRLIKDANGVFKVDEEK